MVNGTEYNVSNIADSVTDFFKRVMAPYGTQMTFVEIVKGDLINTANVVSIREMSDDEVNSINAPKEEIEEPIVGLNETKVEVEGVEELPEVSQ